jgi:hypothetical protein
MRERQNHSTLIPEFKPRKNLALLNQQSPTIQLGFTQRLKPAQIQLQRPQNPYSEKAPQRKTQS